MKRFALVGILAIGGLLLASCTEEAVQTEEPVKTHIVALQLGGEILDVSYSDLTKGENDKDLYGIQVESRVAGETGNYSNYAYGVFDSLEGLTITLLEGKEYKFKAMLVKEGKERLMYYDYSGGYSAPFFHQGTSYGVTPIGTSFTYSSSEYLPYESYLVDKVYLQEGSYYHPDVDSFYGEVDAFVPGSNDAVTIEMKRTVFGLNVIAEGMTEGKLSVQMESAPSKEIVYPGTGLDEIFSFYNVFLAWSSTDYKESIIVSFFWVKENEEEVLIASQSFDFYRNKKTTITVQVVDQNPTAGVSVSLESVPMGDGGSYEIEAGGSGNIDINS